MSTEPSNGEILSAIQGIADGQAALADQLGAVDARLDAGIAQVAADVRSLANLGYTHSRAIAGVQQKVDRGFERMGNRFDLVSAEMGQVRADIVELKAELALLEGAIGEVRDEIVRHAGDSGVHGAA